jgi:hypothetical protein
MLTLAVLAHTMAIRLPARFNVRPEIGEITLVRVRPLPSLSLSSVWFRFGWNEVEAHGELSNNLNQ